MIEWLRPRWRHRDPAVRAAAVREMGPEDQARLGTIARSDPDGGVRRIAIKKLEDIEVLEALAVSEPDLALRELAVGRLGELAVAIATSGRAVAECEAALSRVTTERSVASVAISAAHESIRRAALTRLTGARVLRDVVKGATDPATRRAALDRIQDPAVLRSIATGNFAPEAALAALERIADADSLRAIAENAASKGVRQRARELLSAAPGYRPTVSEKEARARQLALCSAVEALSTDADAIRAATRLRELQREWEELAKDVQPRTDASARFTAACGTILAGAASVARREAYADDARTALEANAAARRELCERVEAFEGADALRDLDRARAAWNRLSPLPPEHGTTLAKRFTLACESCEARHARWLAHAAQYDVVNALLDEAETLANSSSLPDDRTWKALAKRWTSCELSGLTSEELALARHRFASAAERLEQRRGEVERDRSARQQANLERLERLCTRLKELAASEALKVSTARRELETANAALVDLGPLPATERPGPWKERLSTVRDELLRRVEQEEELEGWRRWANVGAQEEIIHRVEGLLESNDLAEGMRQLALLQDEWAAVASAPPDKSRALWERFRTARNELRRRCDAYLAENLEKKRALCAQTAELGASTDWSATAELIRRLQTEWKQIGPVPARYAKSIWQEFREPCDRFFAARREHFERRDVERRENVQQKTALCEQAEALADSTDWDATAAAMKQLQAAWKRSGPLPRAQSDELWQRFRTACDRFFDRSRRRDELEREAALREAGAICDELESFAASLGGEECPSDEHIGQRIDAAWGKWLALDVATLDEAAALHERFRNACERIASTKPDSVRGTRLASDATRKRREKLCARLEALAATAEEGPPAPSLRDMALALRERLATNTIAGGERKGSGRQQDVRAEIARISASWAQLGPPLDEESRALADRFARARVRAAATET